MTVDEMIERLEKESKLYSDSGLGIQFKLIANKLRAYEMLALAVADADNHGEYLRFGIKEAFDALQKAGDK